MLSGIFELVVPNPSGGIAHYFRDNDLGNTWIFDTVFGANLGTVDAVSSNFMTSKLPIGPCGRRRRARAAPGFHSRVYGSLALAPCPRGRSRVAPTARSACCPHRGLAQWRRKPARRARLGPRARMPIQRAPRAAGGEERERRRP